MTASPRRSTRTAARSNPADRLRQLIEQIEHADEVGLDAFGVGEHHRREFLDSAPAVILGAAAARTQRIRLTSAVTVLSAEDPVRVFQNFATLDLLSRGRAEMIVGRGSSIEAFPLFGFDLDDYDALFAEKLDLLLKIREHEHVTLVRQVPAGADRAGRLSAAGAESAADLARRRRHAAVVRARRRARAAADGRDHRRRAAAISSAGRSVSRDRQAHGHSPEQLKVGVHMLGYVGSTTQEAADTFYPGYAKAMTDIGKERGWPPMTRASFDAQRGPNGALLVGSPDEVVDKILRHSEALGGISRITFQMNVASLPQVKMMRAIDAIGARVAPALRQAGNA